MLRAASVIGLYSAYIHHVHHTISSGSIGMLPVLSPFDFSFLMRECVLLCPTIQCALCKFAECFDVNASLGLFQNYVILN